MLYLSSWGGGSRDTPELVACLAAVARRAEDLEQGVEAAVGRKAEADLIRAEILGNLDAQQERLNQVRAAEEGAGGQGWRGAGCGGGGVGKEGGCPLGG